MAVEVDHRSQAHALGERLCVSYSFAQHDTTMIWDPCIRP
jgi:hypothetical protein